MAGLDSCYLKYGSGISGIGISRERVGNAESGPHLPQDQLTQKLPLNTITL